MRNAGIHLNIGVLDITEHFPELVCFAHITVADLVHELERTVESLIVLVRDLDRSAVKDVPVVSAPSDRLADIKAEHAVFHVPAAVGIFGDTCVVIVNLTVLARVAEALRA